MTSYISLFFGWVFNSFSSIYNLLSNVLKFTYNDFTVSLWDGIIAFLVMGVIISLISRRG